MNKKDNSRGLYTGPIWPVEQVRVVKNTWNVPLKNKSEGFFGSLNACVIVLASDNLSISQSIFVLARNVVFQAFVAFSAGKLLFSCRKGLISVFAVQAVETLFHSNANANERHLTANVLSNCTLKPWWNLFVFSQASPELSTWRVVRGLS